MENPKETCGPDCAPQTAQEELAQIKRENAMNDELGLAVLIALMPAVTMTLFNVMGLF